MKKVKIKRTLCFLIACVMLIGVMPTNLRAEENYETLQSGINFMGVNEPLVQTNRAISQIPNTIEMWVKMNPRENVLVDGVEKRLNQPLISSVNPGGPWSATPGDFALFTDEQGSLWWFEKTDATVAADPGFPFVYHNLGTTNLWTGEWMHVAASRQEGKMIFYVNGEKVAEINDAKVGHSATSQNPVVFGHTPVNNDDIRQNNLDGSIGDVRLWSTTRTQDEISRDMNKDITGTEDGLMHNWKFDEQDSTTFKDSVPNGINGVNNIPKLQNGITFTGVNTPLVQTNGAISQIPNTIEMWVKMNPREKEVIDVDGTKKTIRQPLISSGEPWSNTPGFALYTDDNGSLCWFERTDKTEDVAEGQWPFVLHNLGTTNLWTGEWMHVAASRQEGKMIFYVNGEEIAVLDNTNVGYSATPTNSVTFGYSLVDNDATRMNNLDGSIGDVRFWSTTRTQDEICRDMNKDITGTEDGLMHNWKFDEKDSSTFKDSVSNGINVVNNIPKLQSGITFTGLNKPLVQTNGTVSQIPNTIEMWVKMNPRENVVVGGVEKRLNQPLISSVNPGGPWSATPGDFALFTDEQGSLWWFEKTDATVAADPGFPFVYHNLGTTNLWTGEWMHVAASRQEGKMIFYVNGEKVAEINDAKVGHSATPQNPVIFGHTPVNNDDIRQNNLDGSIGDVRLWSNTRTQDEIRQNMNQNIAGTEEGLMHYWKFDEQSGTAFKDSVTNGVEVTITKFAGMNLNLEGKIAFNFFVESNNTLSDSAYVQFELPGGMQKVTKTEVANTEHGLKFTCLVPAKEMADNIVATLYDNGEVIDTKTVSIRDYAEIIINNVGKDADYEKASLLVQTMLQYGACSQQYFDYNDSENKYLANYALSNQMEQVLENSMTSVSAETLNAFQQVVSVTGEEIGTLSGASLILKGETTLRMFFEVKKDVADLTFYVNDEEQSPVKSGNYYVVELNNIAANQLSTQCEVVVTDGTNKLTAKCSAMTFCYNALNNTDTKETLKNVAKILYLYSVQANEYFKQ